jgi:hypothetical protein
MVITAMNGPEIWRGVGDHSRKNYKTSRQEIRLLLLIFMPRYRLAT